MVKPTKNFVQFCVDCLFAFKFAVRALESRCYFVYDICVVLRYSVVECFTRVFTVSTYKQERINGIRLEEATATQDLLAF